MARRPRGSGRGGQRHRPGHRPGHRTGNAFIAFWATAIGVGVVGVALLDPLLNLLGATPQTRGYAHGYALIVLAG